MVPFIGICGNPGSGKSEVQRILDVNHGVKPVDDGYALREFAMNNLGLTWDTVSTQEGKAQPITVCGKEITVRQFLGRVGNALEAEFGDQIIPEITLKRLMARDGFSGTYSFGSVRKTQGLTYRKAGGVIIEVRRPGVGPSGNDFDKFDRRLVDHVIRNRGSLVELEAAVAKVWERIQHPLWKRVKDISWAKAAA